MEYRNTPHFIIKENLQKSKNTGVYFSDVVTPDILRDVCGLITGQTEFTYQYVDIGGCSLDKYGVPITDEAMNICELKHFATDWAYSLGLPTDEDLKGLPKNGKKVAVIGAGPSGLTCAYYLARLGYETDVFEETDRAGGVMNWGIPEYRLPREIVEFEVANIVKAGVNIIYNHEVENAEFKRIIEEYDATYIAIGAMIPTHLGIPGHRLPEESAA